jgi:MFS family permease
MEWLKQISKKTFSSLAIYNFRVYFIGQAISLSGSWMQTIAQDWLVLKLTNSGTQLGLVSAMQFLPILLFAPWGGIIADRFDKRKVLFLTQSVSGLLALLLGIIVLTGSVQIWMVYIFAGCLGLVNSLDNPVRQSFVSEMVGKDKVANAVSLFGTEVSLARAVGPAIAGVVIATVGLGLCFIINSISFVAVIIVLAMMRSSELYRNQLSPDIKLKKAKFTDGFKYVLSSPILFDTLLMMAIIGTFTYEFSVSLPLLAQKTFQGNAASYAVLVSATGIGSILGGLLGANKQKTNQERLITVAFLFGLSFLFVAFMPSLFWAAIVLFFVGIFSVNFISWGNSTIQMESSSEMRGQVLALWAMAFLGSTLIGGPIIGFIGEHAGPRWGIAVGGIAAIIAAGIAAFRFKSKFELPRLWKT